MAKAKDSLANICTRQAKAWRKKSGLMFETGLSPAF